MEVKARYTYKGKTNLVTLRLLHKKGYFRDND
jgi:hypothetical protein